MLELQELTPGQRRAHDLALKTRENILVTGPAGTGKSAVLARIIHDLRRKGHIVKVAAFTGLAAQHIRGTTLAKLLSIGLAKRVSDIERCLNIERAERNLCEVTDLVIDEVSMISGDFLELIDQVMQLATDEHEPFGGIRIIFSGDFMQLPPVRGEREPEFSCKWAFQHPLFGTVVPVTLTESMRQQDERDIKILADLRRGYISPDAKEVLDAAVARQLDSPTELYPINRVVNQVNSTRLAQHPGEIHKFVTYFNPRHMGNDFLGSVPIGTTVEIKKGVPVIILMNHPMNRFVNGSQGVVEDTDWQSTFVRLRNGRRVEVKRKLWTIEDGAGKTIGTVDGMPLHLGWAATIHRAQGMTLDAVQTDVSRCWEPGQAYVALTRTRSLDDLCLLREVKELKVDPEALAYSEKAACD